MTVLGSLASLLVGCYAGMWAGVALYRRRLAREVAQVAAWQRDERAPLPDPVALAEIRDMFRRKGL